MRERRLSVSLWICLAACAGMGFAPYESHMLTARVKRTALIASVKPGQDAALDAALGGLSDGKTARALRGAEITNLSCYKRKLGDKTWVMVYFDYAGDDYLKAATDFESALTSVDALKMHVDPHPRAGRYGTTWLQMEWICYIRGARSEAETKTSYAMVTTIKPEKESEYRLLHQTVWPGVCDQMARGNNRHFSIFLVEIGETLYEFFYVEYVGSSQKKDAEMDRSDPVNLRWWKQTDPCQVALPGEDGIWSMMRKVESTGK